MADKPTAERVQMIRNRLNVLTANVESWDWDDFHFSIDKNGGAVDIWGADNDLLAKVYGNTAYRVGEFALADVYAHAVRDLEYLLEVAERTAEHFAPMADPVPYESEGELRANWLWMDMSLIDAERLIPLIQLLFEPQSREELIVVNNSGNNPGATVPTPSAGGPAFTPDGERMHAGGPMSDHPEVLAAMLCEAAAYYFRNRPMAALLLSAANYVTKSEALKADVRATVERSLQMLGELDEPTKPVKATDSG